LFQGGDVGAYPCPYKCPHCGGCVETKEKLQTHVKKSHTTEQTSFQIELSPNGSRNCKKDRIFPSLELMKPTKSKTQVDKDSSPCQDSFIITLNASNRNEADDEHIQLVCVDEMKVQINRTDEYKDDNSVQDVHLSNRDESVHYSTCFPVIQVKHPVNKKLPEKEVLSSKEETVSEMFSDEHEEHNVSKVLGVEEKYCENKVDANEIVIERVEKSTDSETAVLAEKPDVSIQLLAPISGKDKTELGVVYSGKTPDVTICTVEDPPECLSTETDWNQHTYSESQLFNNVPSGTGHSDNIDVMTEIPVEDDTLSHTIMNHVKQYSSIYSDDSYGSRFCQQVNSETGCDDGHICDTLTKQFHIWKNMEEQSVKGDSGDAKCRILKTYSRRMLRLHSNAMISGVDSPVQLRKSAKEMACVKRDKSDATARQQNE
jgi:hypothetical protein